VGRDAVWLLKLRAGGDQQGYVDQLLGLTDAGRWGATRTLRLDSAQAAVLVENGVPSLCDGVLVAVDADAAEAAHRALAADDVAAALDRALICITCSTSGSSPLVAVRPESIPGAAGAGRITATSTALPARKSASDTRLWVVAAVAIAVAAASITALRSQGQPPPPPQQTGAAHSPASASETVDVFNVAGVTMTGPTGSGSTISEPAALAIAYRDQGRRSGRTARVVEVWSRLVDVDGPGQRWCLCWALRMVVVVNPACPTVGLREYLGYLVDARSGLITEVVDVVIPGSASVACAA